MLVAPGTDEADSRQQVEFALESACPPGWAVDWERARLVERGLAERGQPGAPREVHTWRAVAVPYVASRRDAPVCDLPPERQWVNARAQQVEPLAEHRPLPW